MLGSPLSQSFSNHGSYEHVQVYPLLPRLGDKASVKTLRNALTPLTAGFALYWKRIAMFGATQEISIDRVFTLLEGFRWRAPVTDAAGQIRILDNKTAAIRFRERADVKRIGVNDLLVNLYFSDLLCELNLQSNPHTLA